jgi:hypothetical protein
LPRIHEARGSNPLSSIRLISPKIDRSLASQHLHCKGCLVILIRYQSDGDTSLPGESDSSSFAMCSLLSIRARPVDPRNLTPHWAEVGAELAAVVNRMLERQRKKVDCGHLDHA